jgi:hypothetical protein
MTEREPYLCLTCNRVMILRRNISSREGQPDITIWGCLHCSEKQEADLAVIPDLQQIRRASPNVSAERGPSKSAGLRPFCVGQHILADAVSLGYLSSTHPVAPAIGRLKCSRQLVSLSRFAPSAP